MKDLLFRICDASLRQILPSARAPEDERALPSE